MTYPFTRLYACVYAQEAQCSQGNTVCVKMADALSPVTVTYLCNTLAADIDVKTIKLKPQLHSSNRFGATHVYCTAVAYTNISVV